MTFAIACNLAFARRRFRRFGQKGIAKQPSPLKPKSVKFLYTNLYGHYRDTL